MKKQNATATDVAARCGMPEFTFTTEVTEFPKEESYDAAGDTPCIDSYWYRQTAPIAAGQFQLARMTVHYCGGRTEHTLQYRRVKKYVPSGGRIDPAICRLVRRCVGLDGARLWRMTPGELKTLVEKNECLKYALRSNALSL